MDLSKRVLPIIAFVFAAFLCSIIFAQGIAIGRSRTREHDSVCEQACGYTGTVATKDTSVICKLGYTSQPA